MLAQGRKRARTVACVDRRRHRRGEERQRISGVHTEGVGIAQRARDGIGSDELAPTIRGGTVQVQRVQQQAFAHASDVHQQHA